MDEVRETTMIINYAIGTFDCYAQITINKTQCTKTLTLSDNDGYEFIINESKMKALQSVIDTFNAINFQPSKIPN